MAELLVESIEWEKEDGVPIRTIFGELKEKPPHFLKLLVPCGVKDIKDYLTEKLESLHHQKPLKFKVVDPITSKEVLVNLKEH